ncbi:MAG: DUF6460 domain-containing protein [Hyphomicrobiaceae bacterium]
MEQFFGGSPVAVLFKLVVFSVILGFVLQQFGILPEDLIRSFLDLIRWVYEQGFEAIDWIFQYFLIGAVIVFPVWFLARLFRTRKSEK